MAFSFLPDQIQATVESSNNRDELIEQIVKQIYAARDHYDWVGVYLVSDHTLKLPASYFKGPDTVHKTIPFSEGICGAAATAKRTIVVDNVNEDPRYIACSIATQSEIVVPILHEDNLYGVLDLDSDTQAAFSPDDREILERIADLLGKYLASHP